MILLLLLFCAPQGKLIHRQVKAEAERAKDFARTYQAPFRDLDRRVRSLILERVQKSCAGSLKERKARVLQVFPRKLYNRSTNVRKALGECSKMDLAQKT